MVHLGAISDQESERGSGQSLFTCPMTWIMTKPRHPQALWQRYESYCREKWLRLVCPQGWVMRL